MKSTLIFFLFFFNILSLYAQYNFVKHWDKRLGGNETDQLYVMSNTIDHGYILVGDSRSDIGGDKTQSSRGVGDYWMVKVDSVGNKIWDKRYGGLGLDGPFACLPTSDGYLLGGVSYSGATGDRTEPSWGGVDFWIVKTDNVGDKLWDKRYGGSLDDNLYAIEPTFDGGYILGGFSASPNNGDKTDDNRDSQHFYDDYWVVKIDSTGSKQWDKTFGGGGQDGLVAICQTPDKGFLLGGASRSRAGWDKTDDARDTSQNAFTDDYWIIKIDSVGNKQWDKVYGNKHQNFLTEILKIDSDEYMLAGRDGGYPTGEKSLYWLLTINGAGNVIREWFYDGGAYLRGFTRTSDRGYLLSGDGDGVKDVNLDKTEYNMGARQVWIIKIDSAGHKQWDKTIFTTGFDYGGYPVETVDGCYLIGLGCSAGVGGYKTQPPWNSSTDYFLVKFCMERFNGIEPRTENQERSQINVWPNPFSSDVSIAITGDHASSATFTITNTTGQVVYQQQETNLAAGYTKMLDLSYLPNGIYFVEVSTIAGKAVQRVVKQ